MIDSIFKLLGAGLSLWDTKEKTKYQDKFIKLKKDWYEEYNKADNERSDAVLDNILFELNLLCNSFAAQVGNENSSPK